VALYDRVHCARAAGEAASHRVQRLVAAGYPSWVTSHLLALCAFIVPVLPGQLDELQ
jgi:hypothetical protein